MPVNKLNDYLLEQRAEFTTLTHSPAFTAPEVAQSAHIKGKHLLKVVMVNVDEQAAMVLLDASHHLSLDLLSDALEVAVSELASEKEIKSFFPDCELGAMPPIAHLYGLPLYACLTLENDDVIAFCAGSHSELISMEWGVFLRLAKPKMI